MQTSSVQAAQIAAAQFSFSKSNSAGNVRLHEQQQQNSREELKALLIAICTCSWEAFSVNKTLLFRFQASDVCEEAARLLSRNSRSFRLLSIISHSHFFSDWDCIDARYQLEIYSALTQDSINRSLKETVFHKAAKAIRKNILLQQNARTPTKIRLRNCHLAIANFMHEYALMSDLNRAIVIAALLEGEETGCGHLPSQQAVSLIKKLTKQ